MNEVYTFHETVRGHLHVMREIPCEDFSDSYSAENGKYHIAIVADGHGSKECFRSSFGSQAVTEVAMRCLKEFADSVLVSPETEKRFYKDLFTNPRYRQMTIRRLTDTIIAEWHDRVFDDYNNNPPTEEELDVNAEKYKDMNKIPHIYGTTLIAALLLPSCLLVLHQGDGRCEVFYADGTVDQPVPWDQRCEDTTTTSMCDFDVSTSIRNCIIDISKQNVVACYLGSDGVEDAYRDTYEGIGGTHSLMGGVHTFYKDLSCQLVSMTPESFREYLKKMLPQFSAGGRFSRSGSGDDISVAGIVNIEAINNLTEKFVVDVKKYALEEDLFWKEDELRGKTRKHGILQKRMNEAKEALDNVTNDLLDVEKQQNEVSEKRDMLAQKATQTKEELEKYKKESDEVTNSINGENDESVEDHSVRTFMRMMTLTAQQVYEQLANGVNQIEMRYRKQLEQLLVFEEQLKQLQKSHDDLEVRLHIAEKNFDEAKNNFTEYDKIYQEIDAARQGILKEIGALPNFSDGE